MSVPTNKRFQPFSNGSEFCSWKANNCEKCALQWNEETETYHCKLEKSLDFASVYDGEVDLSVLIKIGWQNERITDCQKKMTEAQKEYIETYGNNKNQLQLF